MRWGVAGESWNGRKRGGLIFVKMCTWRVYMSMRDGPTMNEMKSRG